jgi:hypothetical protein
MNKSRAAYAANVKGVVSDAFGFKPDDLLGDTPSTPQHGLAQMVAMHVMRNDGNLSLGEIALSLAIQGGGKIVQQGLKALDGHSKRHAEVCEVINGVTHAVSSMPHPTLKGLGVS